MAGVTDTPYRAICSRRGAPLCVNEMVTARAIVERHAPTLAMLDHHPTEPLRSLQLYGTDPHYLSEAVRYLVANRPLDHLDLNFGCPAPKVTRLGGGAALPFKRPLFARMIRSAVEAAGSIPVTVKFRMGVDEQHLTFLDAGRIAQDEGVAWVALHARTAEQLYAPSALGGHWRVGGSTGGPGAGQWRHLRGHRRVGHDRSDRVRRSGDRARLFGKAMAVLRSPSRF